MRQVARLAGVGLSIVARVCKAENMSRLRSLEPLPPPIRYEHDAPGDMLHIDTKRLGCFDQPGHRVTRKRSHGSRKQGFEHVFVATDDHSRVTFASSSTQLVGDAAVGNLGRVRWYFQTKYPAQASPINLSSGWEMRLIEAEAKLVGGDVAGAMTSLNARRVSLGLAPWTAANATEAWTALKRERGIELWLESRRLGDFRRWAALSRPGTAEDMTGRDLCFATPLSEKQTDPNF
jgi:hypothetical protein